MAFAKKSTSKEDVKQSASSYINGSGVFPVTILAPFVDTNDSGSSVVHMFLEHEGQQQTVYGNLRVTNNNDEAGEEVVNKIGMKIFNQLLIIAEVDECSDPVEMELPIGKDSADKVVAVLEDLENVDCMLRVQMEYSVWKGQIKENKVIKGFYRAGDCASAEEIVNESETPGAQFEKDKKYFDNITYKNELTPADIEEWVKGGRKGGASGGGSETAAKKKPSFGPKKDGAAAAKPKRFSKKA